MRRHRKLILTAAVIVGGGSIAFTTWYAFYIHSAAYLRNVEKGVTAFFGMPCDIEKVQPRSFFTRNFLNVTMHLPESDAQIFSCDVATWHDAAGSEDGRNFLALRDGRFFLGNALWDAQRYKTLLKPGIGTDIASLNIRGLRLDDFEIEFERDGFLLRCSDAAGDIDFSKTDNGRASFIAQRLNGKSVPDGVRILATLAPLPGLHVSEIRLMVPQLPIADLGLEPFLGVTPTTGVFAGKVEYLDMGEEDVPEARLEGLLENVQLRELTQRVPYGPFEGIVGVSVERARFSNRLLTHFRGSGNLDHVLLSPFAEPLGFEDLDGVATFVFDEISIALSKVERVRFGGTVENVSLEQLLQRWGKGSATGIVSVRVNNFEMIGEMIVSADIEVKVIPPAGEKGLIDRALLLNAAEQGFGLEWPQAIPKNLLPAKIEYVEIGMRLRVTDNRLRIFGSHGKGDRSIITIRDPVFGRPVAVLNERADVYDLTPYIRQILERIRSYEPDEVKQWIKEKAKAGRD